MKSTCTVISIHEDTFRIEENGVRFFLLTGSESALLIDSGMETRNAKEIAESLTTLPLRLLNTHADIDHIGSNGQFDAPYMSPSELTNYFSQGKRGEITPVWDGDVLDLGERKLTVIALPGHTPGSIAALDEKHRMLFSGDPIQDGVIFMCGPMRNMAAYRHGLMRLWKMLDRFDLICPSHGSIPVRPELIGQLIEASEKIMRGEITAAATEIFGMKADIFDAGIAKFLCDPNAFHA